jgi:signal transduction histidine kinase
VSVSLRARILLGIAVPAIAILLVSSAVVHLWVRAKEIAHLDAALATRAASMAALIELEKGYWDVDFTTGPAPKAELFGDLVGYEVRGYPGDTSLAARPFGPAPAPDAVPDVAAGLPGERPLPLSGHAETVDREGATPLRVWSGWFLVRFQPGEYDDADARGGKPGPALADGGEPMVRVVLAEDLGPVLADTREVLAFQVAVAAGLSALALLSSWLLSRRIVDPIEAIATAAEAVRAPSAAPPLAVSGTGDEIDRLTEALNRSFVRLHEAWARQAHFTADASHELRTPLALVRAQAEMALQRDRAPEEYRRALAAVVTGAERLQATLDGLLLLARADADRVNGEAELVHLGALVARVSAGAARADGPAVAIDGPDEVWCRGDERYLEMMFENLLSNAVRHTPADGRVTVRVTPAGDRVRIDVDDTGEGIPAAALPHVFERFYRADPARSRARGGAGLGLAIVRVVAAWHGGDVSVASEEGKGTTVTVWLPGCPEVPPN